MKVNGLEINVKDLVLWHGQVIYLTNKMVQNMKENGKIIEQMEMGNFGM